MNTTENEKTRDRLLSAALVVFAQAGFKSASIRDICAAAGANIAAVNYHFGSKEELYRSTVGHFMNELRAPQSLLDPEHPMQSLKAYFRQELETAAAPDTALYCLVRLRHLEEVAPTGLLDDFLEKHFFAKKACLDRFIESWSRGQLQGQQKDELVLALFSLPSTYVMCRQWLMGNLTQGSYGTSYLERYSHVLATQATQLMKCAIEGPLCP